MKFQWRTSKHTAEQLLSNVAWMHRKTSSLGKFEFMSRKCHFDQPWLLVCVLKRRELEEDKEWELF